MGKLADALDILEAEHRGWLAKPEGHVSRGQLTDSRAIVALIDAVWSLAFYADPETYAAIGFFADRPCGPFMEDFSETDELGMKPGRRAHEALAALNERMGG